MQPLAWALEMVRRRVPTSDVSCCLRRKSGEGGEGGAPCLASSPPFPSFPPFSGHVRKMSVDSPQDSLSIRAIQHVLPQPVVLLGTCLRKPLDTRKRQMAIGIETYGYTQGIGG
jgi:hypothetical protein